jgi:hypothetical protein
VLSVIDQAFDRKRNWHNHDFVGDGLDAEWECRDTVAEDAFSQRKSDRQLTTGSGIGRFVRAGVLLGQVRQRLCSE